MVMKGQFLERATLIPVGDLVLEGLWHRGEARQSLLIVPPSPEGGGNMDHVVCAELAWAAASKGHATLRFNFRGVGASQGRVAAQGKRKPDLQAALGQLKENAPQSIPIVVAIGRETDEVLSFAQKVDQKVCLISPVNECLPKLASHPADVLVVLAEHDSVCDRQEWARKVALAQGQLEIVAGADRLFSRGLPQVGKCVMEWVRTLR